MSHASPANTKLRITNDPMYRLHREGCIKEFNAEKASGEQCDLRGSDFRGLDFRGLDADGLDFRDHYFRQNDLHGVDISKANLEDASITACQISGCPFPLELSAPEIELSLLHGTRMRCEKKN